jgi:hypothetical protein
MSILDQYCIIETTHEKNINTSQEFSDTSDKECQFDSIKNKHSLKYILSDVITTGLKNPKSNTIELINNFLQRGLF